MSPKLGGESGGAYAEVFLSPQVVDLLRDAEAQRRPIDRDLRKFPAGIEQAHGFRAVLQLLDQRLATSRLDRPSLLA
jgi:hypothetical protein